MKLLRKITPVAIVLVLLLAIVSFPATNYIKEYNSSKELYNSALEVYNTEDIERHIKALNILKSIPEELKLYYDVERRIDVGLTNPYRKLRNQLRREINEDYKVSYRDYLEDKYKNCLLTYISDSTNLNFTNLSGDIKETLELSHIYSGLEFSNFHWSPDGKKIAFTDKFYIYIIDVPTREIKKLIGDGKNYNYYHSWSTDGNKLLYLRFVSNNQTEIRVFNQSTKDDRVIKSVEQNSTPVSYPYFISENSEIVFNNGDGNFEVVDLNGTTLKVFDIASYSQEVFLNEEQLDFKKEPLEFLNISNNRETLFITKGDSKILEISTMSVTKFDGLEPHAWAPDSTSWIYKDSEDKLFIVPENRLIIELFKGQSPSWSPGLSNEIISTFN